MRLPRPDHCPGRGAITRNLGKLTKDKDPELRAPGGNGEFAQERVLRHDGDHLSSGEGQAADFHALAYSTLNVDGKSSSLGIPNQSGIVSLSKVR